MILSRCVTRPAPARSIKRKICGGAIFRMRWAITCGGSVGRSRWQGSNAGGWYEEQVKRQKWGSVAREKAVIELLNREHREYRGSRENWRASGMKSKARVKSGEARLGGRL